MKKCLHSGKCLLLAMLCAIVCWPSGIVSSQTVLDTKIMNVWAFGHHAGLDFSSGDPVGRWSSTDCWGEGGASICDVNGKLLFYTNGTDVWDTRDSLMPNGHDLTGLITKYPTLNSDVTGSTTQSSVIVAFPDDPDKYYLFSLTFGEPFRFPSGFPANTGGRLYYSVIDMKLNKGLGDVVPGQKAIFIDSNFMEKMTVVKGGNCNGWVIVQEINRNSTFRSYEVSAAGVNKTPVISSNGSWAIGNTTSYGVGTVKASLDRKHLVSCNMDGGGLVSLFDFDINTGIISNELILDAFAPLQFYQTGYYSATFSPDNSKVYAVFYNNAYLNSSGSGYPYFMYQFDLNSASPPLSKRVVGRVDFADMRVGPDSMLYFSTGNSSRMGRIIYPNKAGGACVFKSDILPFAPGTSGYSGVPNDVIPVTTDTMNYTHSVTITDEKNFVLHAPSGYDHYVWDDGSTDSVRTVSGCGKYYVQASKYQCYQHHVASDTFRVSFDPAVSISTKDIACSEGNMMWAMPELTGAIYDYEWRDNNNTIVKTSMQKANGDTLFNPANGKYYVRVIRSGCDTVYAGIMEHTSAPVVLTDVTPDTTIKYGSSIRLNAAGATLYTWSPAATLDNDAIATPLASPLEDIVYTVYGSNVEGCSDTATVRISIDYDVKEFLPSAFTPNGDGKNDVFRLINITYQKLLEFKIYNRWGAEIFSTGDIKAGWDGTHNGEPADLDVYYYIIRVVQLDGKTRSYMGDVTLIR